jgi:hypothetical protein
MQDRVTHKKCTGVYAKNNMFFTVLVYHMFFDSTRGL